VPPARVVAVVPVFRPDGDVTARIERVLAQVAGVVVVDDGSGASLGPLAAGIEFIAHDRNRGIAAALNTGIARARQLGATHVLTLDQDTMLGDGYVATSLAAFERVVGTRVGATAVDVVNATPSVPTWTSPEGIALAPEAIQSGMLIAVDCLDDAGELDERLFIDSVDREFCHRIRARGWALAIATGTSIEHRIGRLERQRDGSEYEWHEPFRQYYIARNGIVVARRFRREEPEWSKVMLRSTATEAWRIVRNGPRRLKHAIASAAGCVDGLLGRGGRIPRVLERMVR